MVMEVMRLVIMEVIRLVVMEVMRLVVMVEAVKVGTLPTD